MPNDALPLTREPFHEHGFWWWYDPTRRGWYVGCNPAISRPSWADVVSSGDSNG